MAEVKKAAVRGIKMVLDELKPQSKKKFVWNMWYFGKGYSSPPDLREALTAVNAVPQWHGAEEVFHALPPHKQKYMLAVEQRFPTGYPVKLPSSQ
mgnify:CR=1 FL=1